MKDALIFFIFFSSNLTNSVERGDYFLSSVRDQVVLNHREKNEKAQS